MLCHPNHHVSKQTVGASSSKPIVRSGVGYLSANSAIPLPVGYTVVEPTAFTASAPYDMPDFAAYEIDEPDRESMVRELMRHFGVEDKLDGPIPVDTTCHTTSLTPNTQTSNGFTLC
jgi:hypothetical protein